MCHIMLFTERLEADASRNSRESLTPPSLKPTYQIEINHDEDSGTDFHKKNARHSCISARDAMKFIGFISYKCPPKIYYTSTRDKLRRLKDNNSKWKVLIKIMHV